MRIGILGASGRTGRLIVEQALANGHQVRAVVRTPAKLGATCELVIGDATDASKIHALVERCDAVISALGPTADRADVCSVATGLVIAERVKRYVAISGAGIDVPGDSKDVIGKLVSFLVRTFSPAVFHDKVREYELLAASSLPWTLVRPPRLVDRAPSAQVKSSLTRSPGASVSRADLAAFTLGCVLDDALIGKAPFVSS